MCCGFWGGGLHHNNSTERRDLPVATTILGCFGYSCKGKTSSGISAPLGANFGVLHDLCPPILDCNFPARCFDRFSGCETMMPRDIPDGCINQSFQQILTTSSDRRLRRRVLCHITVHSLLHTLNQRLEAKLVGTIRQHFALHCQKPARPNAIVLMRYTIPR